MENIICIVLLSLSFIIFKIIFKINIKKAKAIQENKELEMLTNKFDKNYDIAKDMLDILKNDTVKIEEAKDTKTSLYIWATNKIIIADAGRCLNGKDYNCRYEKQLCKTSNNCT